MTQQAIADAIRRVQSALQRRPDAGRGDGTEVGLGGQQGIHVVGGQALLHPADERPHVGRFLAVLVTAEIMQVVGDAARAHQQHALFAQRCQRPAQRQLVGRAQLRLQRQRHHRDGSVREQEAQRHPGAVIQPAAGIQARRQAGIQQQLLHLGRQLRRTRCRVLQAIQRLREAAEIMDRLRILHGSNISPVCQPMR